MTSATRPRARSALVTAAMLVLLAGAAGCDSGDARLKEGVNAAIDPWFDGAFLGDFPRSDWSAAFAGFTKDTAADAEGRDLDLLTNAAIAGQIDSATATRRRVRLNVFSYRGHPRGATAHFVLDFTTKGALAESMQLRGDLYLAKDKGVWKVFGYDVDQAVPA